MIGRWFEPVHVIVNFCVFFFCFRSLSFSSTSKVLSLNFLLNKVYNDGFGVRREISVK